MTDDPIGDKFFFEHDSGDFALVDRERLAADSTRLAALMVASENREDESATKELFKIHVEMNSPAYLSLLVYEATEKLSRYIVDEPHVRLVPILSGNLARFIMAYRTIRPATGSDSDLIAPQAT